MIIKIMIKIIIRIIIRIMIIIIIIIIIIVIMIIITMIIMIMMIYDCYSAMMKESKLTNFQKRTLEGNMRSKQPCTLECKL